MKNRSALISGILLVLITALALGLRVYRMNAQSLWYDEGFSVYLARMSLAEITARTAADIQPPLYYYLLHAWMPIVGDEEEALRALSMLFGVLAVPLLYGVAWQLFRSRAAGLLAALLMAISPLHIWYSQEVRMYTLLTFLSLLSSYLLLLIVEVTPRAEAGTGWRPGPWLRFSWQEAALWIGYVLTSLAAVYTHYFAFFVLAFQGVYVLLVWAGTSFRPSRLAVGGIGAGLGVLLLYVPWVPNMFTRYGADASFWPGQLKLAEVVQDIAVLFVGGESISEAMGTLLAVAYVLLVGLCLAVLARAGRRKAGSGGEEGPGARSTGQLPLAFLLLYLLLPPALIVLLAWDAPKFNARYVMPSHPAMLLILGGGLAALFWPGRRRAGAIVRGVVGAMGVLFLVGVSAYADYQAYNARAFARPDFRGAARYLRHHIAADEAVILSSGHMFPVFDLYARGLERHLLPDTPTLDTTQTLDYGIADELNGWLGDKGGVWLVLWQDEVVDPVGYLTTMIGQAGEEQAVNRDFSQLRLRHYRFPEGTTFSEQPKIDHPTELDFGLASAGQGDKLRLLGYSQTGPREVTLFWQALQPLDEDYRLSITVVDPNGQSWGRWDGRPSAYLYPTDRWRVGQIVPGQVELVPVAGTPPGDYGLNVGVYTEENVEGLDVLDPAGAALGKRAMLGAATLAVAAAGIDEIEVANPTQADMGGGLSLIGWNLEPTEAQPGDWMLLTLAWSVDEAPQGDYGVKLFITDAASQTVELGPFPPTNVWHPTHTWSSGQAWRGQTSFRLPIEIQPGQAQLAVQLVDARGSAVGPRVDVTTFEVLPTTRTFSAPRPQLVRDANFGDTITLLGAGMPAGSVQAGGTVPLTLYWQAQQEMDIPYTVFVHLLAPDETVLSGNDGQPARGSRPTTGWVPGEVVADGHDLPVPADLPAGYYTIEVGLYDAGAPGMPRLPILGDDGQVATDRVIFPVQVKP